MMSDPATAPKTPVARIIYGPATAVVAAALIYFQPTEYGVKAAILASLTLVCALVPAIEAASRRLQARRDSPSDTAPAQPVPPAKRLGAGALRPASVAVVIIAVTAVAGTMSLAGNEDLYYIERGLTGPLNAQ